MRLIRNHFQPLFNSIMQDTDLGEDLKRFREPIDSDCLKIMKILSPMFHKIYLVIFNIL